MTKQEFFDRHLKGKYFKCSSEEAESILIPMANQLDKHVYSIENKFTLDSKVWPNLITKEVYVEEASLWVVKGIFDMEVNATPSTAPIKIGYLTKLSNGMICQFITDSFAYCLKGPKAIVHRVNSYFKSQMIEVRRCSIPLEEADYDSLPIVWQLYRAPSNDVFLAISYQAPSNVKEFVKQGIKSLVKCYEWSKHITELNNFTRIKKCNKLIVCPPVNFEHDRIIGMGILKELKVFLENHSINDVAVIYSKDGEMTCAYLVDVKEFSDETDYTKSGTLIIKDYTE